VDGYNEVRVYLNQQKQKREASEVRRAAWNRLKKGGLTEDIFIDEGNVLVPNLSPHMRTSPLSSVQIPLLDERSHIKTKPFFIWNDRDVEVH
jgi:hypothetical protein